MGDDIDGSDGRGTGRQLRADARRNEDAVLEAAKSVFAEMGVDAPVREIAARAGLGVGTLYRRFPKRSDLIAAVFRSEVDVCAADAEALAADLPPMEALTAWLMRYSAFITTKRGLQSALHSGDPAFDELPDYFRANFEPALQSLLLAAGSAGLIRSDIDAYDLLRAVGNLSVEADTEVGGYTARMIGLLIDGLRLSGP